MRYFWILLSLVFVLSIVACKKKAPSNVIFVEEHEEVIDTSTVALQDIEFPERKVDWGGAPCLITVKRTIDKERPVVIDASGRKYYDTTIKVRVVNNEGKVFFERAFTKSDFSHCVDSKWKKEGVLLGLPFVDIENGRLAFRGSVGAPDFNSDEYDPVVLYISRSADFQVAYDNKPDFENNSDDQGV